MSHRYDTAWANRTLADDARDHAERQGDSVVFLGEDRPITYASLLADAEALGAGLSELGLRQDDVVSFMVPNWHEAAVINLAAALMGYVINPIVPIYREAETRLILHDCKARAIFIPRQFRNFDYAEMIGKLRPDLPELRHVITVREPADGAHLYADILDSARGRPCDAPTVDPASVKMIMYTSGTTGRPKGVLHSHNTLARAVQASTDYWGIAPGDVVLMPSPVTHVSGYSNGLERPFLNGTRTVLMESWNADAAVRLIDRYGVSMTVAATPFLQELIGAARAQGSSLPSFRFFACGGAAVPPEIVRQANAAFAHPCAFRVYGSSEAPFITLGFLPDQDPDLAAESDGRIVDYEVRIVDDAGNPVEEGEILARGPALFLGYADERQTAEAFTEDGFFRTGDIGRRVAGDGLVITGRKKDLIIRGGENISAKEIEDVLHQHADIQEAAVVAMPHERLGEGVFAFIIAKPGKRPEFQDIISFISRSGLAKQKYPEQIEIVDDFPRTASGKVRKDLLRARLADRQTSKANMEEPDGTRA